MKKIGFESPGVIVLLVASILVLTASVSLYLGIYLQEPDPGVGYSYRCDGPETVIQFAEAGSPLVSGTLCTRVKREQVYEGDVR